MANYIKLQVDFIEKSPAGNTRISFSDETKSKLDIAEDFDDLSRILAGSKSV